LYAKAREVFPRPARSTIRAVGSEFTGLTLALIRVESSRLRGCISYNFVTSTTKYRVRESTLPYHAKAMAALPEGSPHHHLQPRNETFCPEGTQNRSAQKAGHSRSEKTREAIECVCACVCACVRGYVV